MTARSANDTEKLRVIQFTDTHFFSDADHKLLGVETSASFSEVYKLALAQFGVPDFYLLTGDLSQDETEESYRRLSETMKNAGAPCYFLPGNHDRRKDMRKGLLNHGSPFQDSKRVIKGNWQILLLDSLIEGEVGGRLEKEELDFLREALTERPDLYALVTLHHHPIPMKARWLDQIGVANGDEFIHLVDQFKQVRAVLWGHVHQEFTCRKNEILMMSTPSTCVQFKSQTDDFGVDPIPPGYRWLELMPDGSVESAVVRTDKVARGLELSSAGY